MDPENIITCGGGALVLARSRATAAALKRVQESSPLYSPLADMNAALGIAQVAALESFAAVRREVAAAYAQALLKSRHAPLVQKHDADGVLSSFPVVLSDGMKEVRQYALKKNVETAPAFTEAIAALEESPAAHCGIARSLVMRCLVFPLYPMLGKRDVEAVCRVLSTMP
jgi:dTDP-4-amino-4,6-dideoxygalactose transaminase